MEYGKNIPIQEQFYFDIQRRVVAHKTDEGWRNSPHVALPAKIDVTKVLDFVDRVRTSADFEGVRVTLNSVLLKMLAASIKASPYMNAHLQYNRFTRIGKVKIFEDVNIAVPFMTQNGGMITPVLQRVDKISLRALCEQMADMRRRVNNTNVNALLYTAATRDTWMRLFRGDLRVAMRLQNFIGKARLTSPTRAEVRDYLAQAPEDHIEPEELVSSTCIVTNVGSAMQSFRGEPCLIELIPPQVVAIALGAVRKEPVVHTDASGQDQVVIRSMLPYSLCFDHRLMDFEHIMGFLGRLDELCYHPEELLM